MAEAITRPESQPPDITVYDGVETLLTTNDRRSLLALQSALRRRVGEYSYLEIGSAMGGSLQPFVVDDLCIRAYSIDLRPDEQSKDRGASALHPGKSTKRMLTELINAWGEKRTAKITTMDCDANEVRTDDVPERPSFCFIDGEHTDAAVLRDFKSCVRLAADSCVVGFDDFTVIFRGFGQIIGSLRERGVTHRAYVLPDKIGVIEIGDMRLASDAVVADRLVSADAHLYATAYLGHYQDGIDALKGLPGVALARRIVALFPFGRAFGPRQATQGPVRPPR